MYLDVKSVLSMFRLTNKGNQSRKNHKIINQTTKISDTDAPVSQTAVQAQMLQDEEIRKIDELSLALATPNQVDICPPATMALDDMETYILKMNDYLAHMKLLESRNATLERENGQFKEENDHLRKRMNQMNTQFVPSHEIKLKPGAIQEQLQKAFL